MRPLAVVTWCWAIGALVLTTVYASTARAGDEQAADAAFNEGRRLLAAKDYAAACPKLRESFRLDPATGTLLALALCHERQGRLASALFEYEQVAARSKRESREDREKAAREKIAALKPTLSTLTLMQSPDAPPLGDGVEIKRDGATVDPDFVGRPVPLDGGTHLIEVSARGKPPWKKEITIASREEKLVVVLPAFGGDAAPTSGKLGKSAVESKEGDSSGDGEPEADEQPVHRKKSKLSRAKEEPVAAPAEEPSGSSSLRVLGVTALSVGVVGIGAGTFFLSRAISKNNDSKSGCDGDACLPDAKQDRLDARTAGDWATISFVAGGALVGGGLLMYVLAPSSSSPPTVGLQLTPVAGPGSVGGVLRGRF